jgi:hypothetical protein
MRFGEILLLKASVAGGDIVRLGGRTRLNPLRGLLEG